MKKAVDLLLAAGLVTSSLAAIAYSIRALIGIVHQTVNWDFAGLLAVYAGPVFFATALYIVNRSGAFASEKTELENA